MFLVVVVVGLFVFGLAFVNGICLLCIRLQAQKCAQSRPIAGIFIRVCLIPIRFSLDSVSV